MSERPPRDDDWIFDPGLAAINRSLQRELRDEAEEVETDVEESELRERTFADVAREARNRGDFLGVTTSRRTFNGHVIYAAGDFLTILTDSFEADINLADVVYLRVIERGKRRGGQAADDGAGTFELRLMERRSRVDRVELGYRAIDETVIGRIVTVGQDHVMLVDDHKLEWAIPLSAISWVVRREQRRAR